MSAPAISPLQLYALTRDYYGHYDAWVIAQLAPLAENTCYQPRFYKAPASQDELIPAYGTAQYGLKLSPGDLIYGTYLPATLPNWTPLEFSVQIVDSSLRHSLFDSPIPSIFLANAKPTGVSANPLKAAGAIFAFPNLWTRPYPVVGDGLFMIDIWNQAASQQRIELVFGVLHPVECD